MLHGFPTIEFANVTTFGSPILKRGWHRRKRGLRVPSPFRHPFTCFAAVAAGVAFLATLALQCFLIACFLTACFLGVAVATAGAVTVAGTGTSGAADACAKDTAATEDRRVFKLVVMNFQKGSSRVCAGHLEQAQCHSGVFP